MNRKIKRVLAVLAGVAIGGLCGTFGGGGGILAIPVLKKLYGLKERNAHATAVFVVLPLSLVAAAGYMGGGKVDPGALTYVLPAMTAGGWIGSRALKGCSGKALQLSFALLLSLSGIYMICSAL